MTTNLYIETYISKVYELQLTRLTNVFQHSRYDRVLELLKHANTRHVHVTLVQMAHQDSLAFRGDGSVETLVAFNRSNDKYTSKY